ncbi:MAG: RHS repeat-associated core domain-containing protein [Bacteroidales bacterium]|nr:RHS repeat-associated core domain-containing protein [Bacteroidales bacterium]
MKETAPPGLQYLHIVTKNVTKQWDNDEAHSYVGISITNQAIEDIDEYGNSLKSNMITDEWSTSPDPAEYSWKKSTETSYIEPNEEEWLIARPASQKLTTFHRLEEENTPPEVTNLVTYHYYAPDHISYPLLEYVENIPNNNADFLTKTSFTYDKYGHITNESVQAKNSEAQFETRTTAYVYDENNGYEGRFLTRITKKADNEMEDVVTEMTYDILTGRLLTSTDVKRRLTSTYEYDKLGKLQSTIMPDQTSAKQIYGWCSELTGQTPPANALYFTSAYKQLAGSETKWSRTYTFFDKYGRNLRSVSHGLKGDLKQVDYIYDELGRLSQVSEPYFSNDTPTQWTTYEYDALGRVFKQTLPTETIISTTFRGRTTKVVNSSTNVWNETTVNAIGQPDIVKDPTQSTINYNYDAGGRVRSVLVNDTKIVNDYNDAGFHTKTIDPDAGITQYAYNGFGDLTSQIDARNNKQTIQYDKLGRIITRELINDQELIEYQYEKLPENNGFGLIKSITKTLSDEKIITTSYAYDELSRPVARTETVDENNFTFVYKYNKSSGMLETYTFPTGYQIYYFYNPYGYLDNVVNFEKGIEVELWRANAANARGQLTDFSLGNGLTTTKEFDPYGFPRTIVTSNINNYDVQYLSYSFNASSGNLRRKWEKVDNNYLNEDYEYDPVLKSRLTSWKVYGGTKFSIEYADNGNIQTKTDITNPVDGKYTYGANAGPHAVTGIENPTEGYASSSKNQSVIYNGINKVKYIRDLTQFESIEIDYGVNDQRIKSLFNAVHKSGGKDMPLKTKYYFGDFEVEINHQTGQTRFLHYLSAGSGLFAIVEIKNKQTTPFYIHTDYQGNYNVISDIKGGKIENLSFDPWGRRRNPTDWSFYNVPTSFLFDRGYTGHEHLDKFGLINMNGRVYDPFVARFLSPDPIIQSPGNAQNYNRYSYALNNPLKYTDPSGYKYRGADMGFNPGGFVNHGFKLPQNGTPGSGNYWGDAYGPMRDDFTFMSEKSFNAKYGIKDEYDDADTDNSTSGDTQLTFTGEAAQALFQDLIDAVKNQEDSALKQLALFLNSAEYLGANMSTPNPFFEAVAISIDIGGSLVGAEKDWGGFFILAGKNAGEYVSFSEIAGGAAPDLSGSIEIGRVDFSGNAADFEKDDLFGDRTKLWIGAGAVIGGNIGFAFGKSGEYSITTTSVSLGVALSPIIMSLGFNVGKVEP